MSKPDMRLVRAALIKHGLIPPDPDPRIAEAKAEAKRAASERKFLSNLNANKASGKLTTPRYTGMSNTNPTVGVKNWHPRYHKFGNPNKGPDGGWWIDVGKGDLRK